MESLKVVSISHTKADISIRGKFSCSEAEGSMFLEQLKEVLGISQAMLVSTCNRTEVFYVSESIQGESVVKLLCMFKGVGASEYFIPYFDFYQEEGALRYLFGMAVGLESQVLGDIQIFGQVKQAYNLSVHAGMAEAYLHRLMHTIFFTHKKINQETSFKEGAASISYNALKIMDKHFSGSLNHKVLVVGAGQMGTDICRNLSKSGYTDVTVTNRTHQKAIDLSTACNINVLDYQNLDEQIMNFDAVFISVSCNGSLYKISDFIVSKASLVLDVCSPKSVERDVEDTAVKLYNIDDIGLLTKHTIDARQAEIPKVASIIDDAILEFKAWLQETAFTPSIKKLKETLEDLRQQALIPYVKNVDEEQSKVIDNVTKKIVQKIIQLPVLQLKSACQRGNAEALSESLNELFNLEYNKTVKS